MMDRLRPTSRAPLTAFLALSAACSAGSQNPATAPSPAAFADYWYRGKAEISRFDLEQYRYGEKRHGYAVLVFVTEPFRPERQVKAETEGGPSVTVLKLNHIARFTTGIYDYSLMRSVFTPVATDRYPHSLKVTASVQDWCGQVWQQLNLRDDGYRLTDHSYFEAEADSTSRVDAAWLEDEVWTRIRLDPQQLPRGDVRMIPGVFDSRLHHRPLRPEAAVATLEDVPAEAGEPARQRYRIEYPSSKRALAITFDRAFPHRIESFEERREDPQRGTLTSRAVRTHWLQSDYWNHHAVRDDPLRQRLGLGPIE